MRANIKTIRNIVAATLIILPSLTNAQRALHDNALRLMTRLNGEIAKYQINNTQSTNHGAIYCPGCQLYHTRAAEAMFPLAYEYSITGNKTRLQEAIDLGNWLIKQQQQGGQWLETPETWTGTSTDQLLMMLLTYPLIEKQLTKEQQHTWRISMERAADYLTDVMDNRFASINYCATTTATLAAMYHFQPKESYRTKAKQLAQMIVGKMNPEYFIEGEGSREGQYKFGIDLGYNMEMSLWGLAYYADLMADSVVAEAVAKATANHLWFIYPDGMLEASSGIRSNKWTVYGSGTSDGCHPLLALMSNHNPAYITAAVRNIEQIEKSLTKHGLLGMGPHYDMVQSTPPCIYPTFTKAKSAAMAMSWVKADNDATTPLPTQGDGFALFKTMNTAVVRSGPFCATITAYPYKAKEGAASKYMHRPAGGTMSALWVEDIGLVQASSQSEYHRWEPMSFPELPNIKPLTPRIEVELNDKLYTNLYEYDATFHTSKHGNKVIMSAYGFLKDRNQRPTGVSYTVNYNIEPQRLVKQFEITRQTTYSAIRIIEPIVVGDDRSIELVDANNILLSQAAHKLRITCHGGTIVRDTKNEPNYWGVYPSLRAVPFVIEIAPSINPSNSRVTLTYTIEK